MNNTLLRVLLVIAAIAASVFLIVFIVSDSGYLSFFNVDDVSFPEEEETEQADYTPVPVIPGAAKNRLFGLACFPDENLNPITSENAVNKTLSGLIYEPLFALNDDWEPEGRLVTRYEKADDLRYVFYIRQDVLMHDGSPLTAADCEYSLNLARSQGPYKNRLSILTSVRATGTHELTVSLSRPLARVAALLDVPVIRANDTSRIPAGTGPYMITGIDGETPRLAAFSDWWKKAALPASNIELIVADNVDSLIESFELGAVDVLASDPTGTEMAGLRGGYELWSYDTLTLQYIGFNTARAPFKNVNIRRAVSLAIDREFISETVFSGYVMPAEIIIPDTSPLYNADAAKAASYDLVAMSDLLHREGFEDKDNDGVLEYMNGSRREPMKPDLIVNAENSYKVKSAEAIAAMLMDVGVEVNVRALKWDDYKKALAAGDFDMYYGETRLTADFSPRFCIKGSEALPYSSAALESLILAFEANPTSATAGAMCRGITEESPFVPLLFKKEYVYTPRGVIRGVSPTQSNIFRNFEDWVISK